MKDSSLCVYVYLDEIFRVLHAIFTVTRDVSRDRDLQPSCGFLLYSLKTIKFT